jgi:hypothetical protein
MKIPTQNNWTQLNSGDRTGILAETENINLDTDGKVRLSRKAFSRVNSVNDANFNHPLSIVYYNNQYIVLTRENAFLFDLGGSNVTEIVMSTDIDLNSDMVVCYNRAYITTDDNLDFYDGSLDQSNYSLTTGVPHPLTVFDALPTYKLCVGNGNTVVPLDSSHNPGTILTLPAQYQVTTLEYRNTYLYVGTKHLNGGEARIFIWNGTGTNAQYEVPVGASNVYSIRPYKDAVAAVLNSGQILLVNGTSTTQLAAFPVFYEANAVWDNTAYLSAPQKVLNRGMVTVGDSIYFNVDGTVDSQFMPSMKHGIWVYNPQRGLYHTSGSSADRSVVQEPSALSDGTLTLATHNLKDGDLVVVRTVGSLTGVKTGQRYFAKVISTTQIKLALSFKSLLAGRYVDIGGSVTGSIVSCAPNTDYAQSENSFSGPITAINPEEPFFVGWETPIIWGTRIQDRDGNEFYGICSFTQNWNIGRITTQRIYTDNIKQTWKKVYSYLSGCLLDNEQIVVKYKDKTALGYPTPVFQGVWLNTNTINSDPAGLDQDEWRDLTTEDEITITDGYGRGYTAHITAIESSSSTYSITLDESVGTANEPVYFYADNFKKAGVITNQRDYSEIAETILSNVSSAWVQIKMELRGFEIEVDMLDLANAVNQSSD